MMTRKQSGEKMKMTGTSDPTPFTGSPHDIGNLPYWDSLQALRQIIALSLESLKERGHVVLFCKDLQPSDEHHNLLHADVVDELLKLDGLAFRGYKIWHDMTPSLYPFGYPFAFVANQLHQFILIFRKGS